jgi:pimeloyl-ACP methyl ester carboxylesterase
VRSVRVIVTGGGRVRRQPSDNGTGRGWLTGLAHTLPYDVGACGSGCVLPADRLAKISVPALALGGGESPGWMPAAARAVAEAVQDGRYVTIEGEDHGVLRHLEALRPVLTDFFG